MRVNKEIIGLNIWLEARSKKSEIFFAYDYTLYVIKPIDALCINLLTNGFILENDDILFKLDECSVIVNFRTGGKK